MSLTEAGSLMAVRPLAGSSRRMRLQREIEGHECVLVFFFLFFFFFFFQTSKRQKNFRGNSKTYVGHDNFLPFRVPRLSPEKALRPGRRYRQIEERLLRTTVLARTISICYMTEKKVRERRKGGREKGCTDENPNNKSQQSFQQK